MHSVGAGVAVAEAVAASSEATVSSNGLGGKRGGSECQEGEGKSLCDGCHGGLVSVVGKGVEEEGRLRIRAKVD